MDASDKTQTSDESIGEMEEGSGQKRRIVQTLTEMRLGKPKQVNMSRDLKDNKKRFYMWQTKTKGKCRHIFKSEELKTKDMEITK